MLGPLHQIGKESIYGVSEGKLVLCWHS